ncbi:MAG: hypothetical protein ABI140_09175 [Jatrophihabitantaceae bacterium]
MHRNGVPTITRPTVSTLRAIRAGLTSPDSASLNSTSPYSTSPYSTSPYSTSLNSTGRDQWEPSEGESA